MNLDNEKLGNLFADLLTPLIKVITYITIIDKTYGGFDIVRCFNQNSLGVHVCVLVIQNSEWKNKEWREKGVERDCIE